MNRVEAAEIVEDLSWMLKFHWTIS